MNKKYRTLFSHTAIAGSLLVLLTLSGCQSLSGYTKIENAENAALLAGQIIPMPNEVNIACAGTYHCEISQIDSTEIISIDTHKPVNPTLLVSLADTDGTPYAKLSETKQLQVQAQMPALTTNKSVKIIALSASGMPGLANYYASVKPIKREVHVNFYPENNLDYVERFAMIDEFKDPGIYLLKAYRQKPSKADVSLLEGASPAPLCIDLLKDNVLQRHFCKQMDSDNEGEFIEVSVTAGTKAK